ncbi:hypothetical protein [Actinoplanes regularis]|uniref:hypothetical protein n=1 Tax=Actinoplanes regularis TaxID=52697 RepID=UPI0024A2EED7|nr:hypothetical protein [Actinoplanes regularis]GLW29096.1 hypothetical protein Areg01_20360 [Actinoplanes regularis]
MSTTDPGPTTAIRPSDPARTPAWVWALLMLLFAVIIGGVSGILAHASDVDVPGAILAGGAALGGTILVELAIAGYLRGDR